MFTDMYGITDTSRNGPGRFGLFYRGFGGGLLRLRFSIVSEFFLNHSFTSFFNSYLNNYFKIILIRIIAKNPFYAITHFTQFRIFSAGDLSHIPPA